MAVLSCDVEWTGAVVHGLVHVGSMLQQTLDHRQMAVLRCDVEWTGAVVYGLVHVSPMLQQTLDHS